MQKGYIYKLHGSWHVRYRANGTQVSSRIAPVCDQYRNRRSVRDLADEILEPINEGKVPRGPQTLQNFIEAVFLPHAKSKKRPSTYKGYNDLYHKHIAPRIGGLHVRRFRTVDGQRLLDAVADENQLSDSSLANIKTVLSASFNHAKRVGAFDGANPMHGVAVPDGVPTEDTYAYSFKEVDAIAAVLDGMARAAVILAAHTGLSLAELRGLKWEDISDTQVTVKRTIWHMHEGLPKTKARGAAVPLHPLATRALAQLRKQNSETKWVFEGARGWPLDLATLGSKTIKAALQRHGMVWYGWHALRRGFSTTLHADNVQLKTIQSLMRHSDPAVTMKHYIKALPTASVQAIGRLRGKSKIR